MLPPIGTKVEPLNPKEITHLAKTLYNPSTVGSFAARASAAQLLTESLVRFVQL
jgi:hypothetical protein